MWKLSDHTAQVVSLGTETHIATLAYKKTSLQKAQIAEFFSLSNMNRRWIWMFIQGNQLWLALLDDDTPRSFITSTIL